MSSSNSHRISSTLHSHRISSTLYSHRTNPYVRSRLIEVTGKYIWQAFQRMVLAKDVFLLQLLFEEGERIFVPVGGRKYGDSFVIATGTKIDLTQEFAHGRDEVGDGVDVIHHVSREEDVRL
mmetsp:Transcript_43774/g.93077  ORF Transcript_43774/g.93077 Transcript_43774/m.93077 type:complete len:122 (+) Transcript_43774:105-470(+)